MKLFYFDVYGRGEPLRMILSYSKTPYEDIRLTHEEFQKMKAEGKFTYGQVPALEMDGEIYVQSNSLLRMVGKKTGMYPEDANAACAVDGVLDALYDMGKKMEQSMLKSTRDEMIKAAVDCINGPMKELLKIFDSMIGMNGNWHLVGDKMSIADISFGSFCFNALLNEKGPYYDQYSKLLEGNENLAKFIEGFKTELAEYLASRPKNMF